jgi:hypothetical protein
VRRYECPDYYCGSCGCAEKYEARLAWLERLLGELEAKPYRAEEIVRRYREQLDETRAPGDAGKGGETP